MTSWTQSAASGEFLVKIHAEKKQGANHQFFGCRIVA